MQRAGGAASVNASPTPRRSRATNAVREMMTALETAKALDIDTRRGGSTSLVRRKTG